MSGWIGEKVGIEEELVEIDGLGEVDGSWSGEKLELEDMSGEELVEIDGLGDLEIDGLGEVDGSWSGEKLEMEDMSEEVVVLLEIVSDDAIGDNWTRFSIRGAVTTVKFFIMNTLFRYQGI